MCFDLAVDSPSLCDIYHQANVTPGLVQFWMPFTSLRHVIMFHWKIRDSELQFAKSTFRLQFLTHSFMWEMEGKQYCPLKPKHILQSDQTLRPNLPWPLNLLWNTRWVDALCKVNCQHNSWSDSSSALKATYRQHPFSPTTTTYTQSYLLQKIMDLNHSQSFCCWQLWPLATQCTILG